MTNQEKEQKALDIVTELKTAKQETRDAWKKEALASYPNDAEFINQAYNMASE